MSEAPKNVVSVSDLEKYLKDDKDLKKVTNLLEIIHYWNGGRDDKLHLEDFERGLTSYSVGGNGP